MYTFVINGIYAVILKKYTSTYLNVFHLFVYVNITVHDYTNIYIYKILLIKKIFILI